MPQALLKLRVGLRGPGWRYEAHPLRSEAKHNICRLIYHSAHLTAPPPFLKHILPSSTSSLSARTRTLTPRLRVTATDCFSFSELKARIIQAVLAALAKFPPYLIRGIDILDRAMRNCYVFTPAFFLTLLLPGVFLWLLRLMDS